MIMQVIIVTVSCFAGGAVLMALANRKVPPETRRQRWVKFATYFMIVHAVLGASVLGRPWLLGLVIVMLAIGVWELHHAAHLPQSRLPGLEWRILSVYTVLAIAVLFTVAKLPTETIAYLYLVVASFDGFSQIIGQLLGHRKITPKVSPNKTVEGLVGGILGALAIAWIFQELAGLETPFGLVAGAAIAVCGLAGDLSASWVKRRAGIKDFSALIPGHGGVLDRFDSFIGAGAIVGPALYAISRALP
jgi:phosphatidate cytidylyltransferase